MPLIQGKSKKALKQNVESEMESGEPQDKSLAIAYSIQRKNKKKMAEGGMVDAPEEMEERPKSIAAAIMQKKKMADGGMVDLSQNADEEPNHEDDLSFEALKKENYSESEGLEALSQPEGSNLHGHDLSDEDAHDMISALRRKIMAKKGR